MLHIRQRVLVTLVAPDDATSVNGYEVDIGDTIVTEDSEVKPSQFSLSSASYAYKHGQGRKVSTASTCTIKSNPGHSDSSDSSSPSSRFSERE